MAKAKVAIPVSRTNFNRVRFQTHTIKRVLELEGISIDDSNQVPNPITGKPVSLDMVELVPKKKVELVIIKEK